MISEMNGKDLNFQSPKCFFFRPFFDLLLDNGQSKMFLFFRMMSVTCVHVFVRWFQQEEACDMLTEDNDPTKPAGVLDNVGNVSSSTEQASVQNPRNPNNGNSR